MDNMAIFANFRFKTFLSGGLALGKTKDDGMHLRVSTAPNNWGAPWDGSWVVQKWFANE